MESLSEIVAALEDAFSQTPLADFYAMRKQLKGGHQWRGPLLQIQKDANKPRSGYAYHKGGRGELQFNIGFEDEGAYFRYGVAFSLEPSRELPNPTEVLAPKISRFDRAIAHFPNLASLKMWNHSGVRSPVEPLGPIPDTWIRNGVFIFIGERVPVPLDGVSLNSIARAAQILTMLLPLYQRIEDKALALDAPIDYRVARLCWNTDFWQAPTGWKGKSRNPKAFEAQQGYGHEEWLFNKSVLLDGWKYGFLQALNHSHEKYAGEHLSLLLYSIDSDSKRRYWVGVIDDAEVLTISQARQASKDFTRCGLLKSMRGEVKALGLDSSSLIEAGLTGLANVRFRPYALRIFDPPVPFPAKAVPSNYYGTLQKVPREQKDILGSEDAASALIERNLNALKTTRHVYESTTEVDLVQTEWQRNLRKTIAKDLPHMQTAVETNVDGHRIDIVLTNGSQRIFVELKTRGTVRQIIREALSQLLEYAYWPDAKRCQTLLIVGASSAGGPEHAYLRMLRERFSLPVYYLQYDNGHIIGISDWWRTLPAPD